MSTESGKGQKGRGRPAQLGLRLPASLAITLAATGISDEVAALVAWQTLQELEDKTADRQYQAPAVDKVQSITAVMRSIRSGKKARIEGISPWISVQAMKRLPSGAQLKAVAEKLLSDLEEKKLAARQILSRRGKE